jgi:hypothetical protein
MDKKTDLTFDGQIYLGVNLKIVGFCDFQLSPFICRKGFGESRIFFGSFLFEKK